jgi:hypothetical protein
MSCAASIVRGFTESKEKGGKYETQFSAPLILKPCEHLLDKNKKRLGNEIWYLIVHGKSGGTSEVTKHCEKLEGV